MSQTGGSVNNYGNTSNEAKNYAIAYINDYIQQLSQASIINDSCISYMKDYVSQIYDLSADIDHDSIVPPNAGIVDLFDFIRQTSCDLRNKLEPVIEISSKKLNNETCSEFPKNIALLNSCLNKTTIQIINSLQTVTYCIDGLGVQASSNPRTTYVFGFNIDDFFKILKEIRQMLSQMIESSLMIYKQLTLDLDRIESRNTKKYKSESSNVQSIIISKSYPISNISYKNLHQYVNRIGTMSTPRTLNPMNIIPALKIIFRTVFRKFFVDPLSG